MLLILITLPKEVIESLFVEVILKWMKRGWDKFKKLHPKHRKK
jgi:hypothetical protein